MPSYLRYLPLAACGRCLSCVFYHAGGMQLLCSDVFKMLMHTKHDGVEMRLEIPKGLFVLGDAVRWRQLLINLLSTPPSLHAPAGSV